MGAGAGATYRYFRWRFTAGQHANRIKIAEMIKRSGEGHIPSSFSIVDIIEHLYRKVLKYDFPLGIF